MTNFLLKTLPNQKYVQVIAGFLILFFLIYYVTTPRFDNYEEVEAYYQVKHFDLNFLVPLRIFPSEAYNIYELFFFTSLDAIIIGGFLVTLIVNVVNSKRIGLMRYLFAFIFIDNVMSILFGIKSALGYLTAPVEENRFPFDVIKFIIFQLASIIFCFLSYKVLQYYRQNRVAAFEVYETDGSKTIYYMETSLGARAGNNLADYLLIFLIFGKYIYLIAESAHSFNSPVTLYLLVFGLQIFYFTLTETLFCATPGKFLTATRVIDYDGKNIGFPEALQRSLCRFIPFDKFSFIFNANWHDKISQTWVVNEVDAQESEQ